MFRVTYCALSWFRIEFWRYYITSHFIHVTHCPMLPDISCNTIHGQSYIFYSTNRSPKTVQRSASNGVIAISLIIILHSMLCNVVTLFRNQIYERSSSQILSTIDTKMRYSTNYRVLAQLASLCWVHILIMECS